MRHWIVCLVLSTPLLAQEFAFDPDFERAAYDYEVSVSSDLPGFGAHAYQERFVLDRSTAGEIELRREGSSPTTFVYDRRWRLLRIEGWGEPLGGLGRELEIVLGPAAGSVLSELDVPAGPGAMDPATLVRESPLSPRRTKHGRSALGPEPWYRADWTRVDSIEEMGGVRVARIHRVTTFLVSGFQPATLERESVLHASGLPESSTWSLRVGEADLLRFERRRVRSGS